MNAAALGGSQAQRSAASGHPHHQHQYSDQFLLESATASTGSGGSTWLQSQQVDYLRMLRSMQRGMSGDFLSTDPSTPPLSSRSSSLRRDGDDVELSPGILDLHSFDTELLPEMPVHGAGAFGYAQGRSFDDPDPSIYSNRITTKPCTVSENNLLKSLPVDSEKSGSVAKIKVVVRKRPLNKKEISKKEEDIITIDSDSNYLTVHETKLKVDLTEYVEKHEFVFDAVLDEDVSNDKVYHETVEPIIPAIFQRTKATCFAYGQTDVKYPVSIIEHGPVSRNKKNGDGLLDNVSTSSKNKENGKKLCSGDEDFSLRSWPKYHSKQLHKKHVKRRSSPKQARTDHPDVSMNSHTIKGCTADKSRVVKHKHRQESKRSDRKTMRMTVKAKFDSFMSKDSLVNSHLAFNGSNVFGTFGVKFDLLDVTKNVDELSLSELLDGSYKCPNLCHDKVKKASTANDSILLSVRKAASILATPSTGGSSCSRKASGVLTSTDCDEEEKYVEESAFSHKIQDQATVSDSGLYQPKDILERLALPAAQDLNSILADSCLPMAPLKGTTSVRKASLPPFPWSFSLSGPCKPIVDNNKSATSRSTSQGRWVRIGSSSCLVGEEHSCFSELDLTIDGYTGDSKPQHFGDHSLSLETLKLHDNLSYNVQNCMPHDANAIPKPISMSDISTSKQSSNVLSSYDPFNPMAVNMDSSNVYQLGFKESAAVVDMETEGILHHEKNESNLVNQSISNLQKDISYTEEEDTVKDIWDHNGKNYYPSYGNVGGTKQCLSRSPIPEGSNSDYSPRLLAAASILCDMASTRERNHNTGKAIWPNLPSQTAMKARKTRPFIGKTDRPKPAVKTTDPIKRTNRMASPEHKPIVGDDKSKGICMSSVGRGPVRWSAPTENTNSTKSGRDFAVKPLQGSPVGLMGQASLSTRAERGYDGHRKHRSATVMTASVSTTAIYLKDWGKGRHRRE